MADEDAPEVAEETRFWVLVGQEKTDTSTVRWGPDVNHDHVCFL